MDFHSEQISKFGKLQNSYYQNALNLINNNIISENDSDEFFTRDIASQLIQARGFLLNPGGLLSSAQRQSLGLYLLEYFYSLLQLAEQIVNSPLDLASLHARLREAVVNSAGQWPSVPDNAQQDQFIQNLEMLEISFIQPPDSFLDQQNLYAPAEEYDVVESLPQPVEHSHLLDSADEQRLESSSCDHTLNIPNDSIVIHDVSTNDPLDNSIELTLSKNDTRKTKSNKRANRKAEKDKERASLQKERARVSKNEKSKNVSQEQTQYSNDFRVDQSKRVDGYNNISFLNSQSRKQRTDGQTQYPTNQQRNGYSQKNENLLVNCNNMRTVFQNKCQGYINNQNQGQVLKKPVNLYQNDWFCCYCFNVNYNQRDRCVFCKTKKDQNFPLIQVS